MPGELLKEISVTPVPTRCDLVPSCLRLALFWLLTMTTPTQEKMPEIALPVCCVSYIQLKQFMPRMTYNSYINLIVS